MPAFACHFSRYDMRIVTLQLECTEGLEKENYSQQEKSAPAKWAHGPCAYVRRCILKLHGCRSRTIRIELHVQLFEILSFASSCLPPAGYTHPRAVVLQSLLKAIKEDTKHKAESRSLQQNRLLV